MNIIRKIFILPIRFYQKCISPLLPARCRFYPSCSAYTVEAISTHGVLFGIALGIKRILRCNPWCDGGFDPVPKEKKIGYLNPFKKIDEEDKD